MTDSHDMRELSISSEICERIAESTQVIEAVTESDPGEINLELASQTILMIGLDLMMAAFFRRLDEQTLRESLDQFFVEYPNAQKPEPLGWPDNALVNMHVALSRRYPKQFFRFMFEKLKTTKWANAKEEFEKLFRKSDMERNGEAE